MNTESVDYRDGEARLRGFLVWDSTRDGRRPGILVAHGGAGLDDHAKGRARRLAGLGYVAFACDMYGESVTGNRERVMETIRALQSDRASLVARAQAALFLLRSHPLVDERVGAVGYCLGGLVVLELARSGAPLQATVSVHGNLATREPAGRGAVQGKILVCHGALDPHVPMTQVTTFCDEMNQAGVDYQLTVYGGAVHGFTHETATGSTPGVAYHALTDARSSAAIRTFLAETFS
jgi:dienelactone hydrolase